MVPRLGKVVGAENRVEDTGEIGNRSLGTDFPGPQDLLLFSPLGWCDVL